MSFTSKLITQNSKPIMQLLLYLFLICLVIQLAYWLVAFAPLANYQIRTKPVEPYPISVVICAYNEGYNLKRFLPIILEQVYDNYEVIVVNDRSTDDSEALLTAFQQQYSHLRVLHLKDFERTVRSKKFALTKGLEAATHEVVLLTDGDCYPASKQWVAQMAKMIDGQKAIGLGYMPADKRTGFLNLFIRYDKVYNTIQYFSFALLGIPYMGVGGNLIYKRDLFFKVQGFNQHQHLISGDDDLFISAVSNRHNTDVQLHPDSFIYCEPQPSWQRFYNQKTRHLSTSWLYKWYHKLLLGVLAQSHFWLYVTFAMLLIFQIHPLWALGGFALRWAVMGVQFYKITHRLQERDLQKWLFLMDVLYIVFYVVFASALVHRNKTKWE